MSGQTVAVIGAGLMGHGIAWLLGAAGHRVRVQDPSRAALDALPGRMADICALLDGDAQTVERIKGGEELAWAVGEAHVVIEAAPENLLLKQELFEQLERLAPADAILCTNTSVLPVRDVAERVEEKARVVGTHFWNPPHLVRLVEIILMGEENRPAAMSVADLLRGAGQHPVLVNRDIPGAIGNRLQHALKREAIALVEAGVCDAETVDDVVKLGFGGRLAVLGPLEQSDLVGLELTKAIHDVLLPELDATPHTQALVEDLIAKGETGMRAGKGFRSWTEQEAEAVRARLRDYLAKSAAGGKAR